MSYSDKVVDECIKELLQEMRIVHEHNHKKKDSTRTEYNEYRISEKQVFKFKYALLKLYREGFEQGVYTAK